MRKQCSPRVERSAAACWLANIVASVSCGRGGRASPSPGGGEAASSVVVYCSADKEFAELIFRAYEAKTGAKVLPHA